MKLFLCMVRMLIGVIGYGKKVSQLGFIRTYQFFTEKNKAGERMRTNRYKNEQSPIFMKR